MSEYLSNQGRPGAAGQLKKKRKYHRTGMIAPVFNLCSLHEFFFFRRKKEGEKNGQNTEFRESLEITRIPEYLCEQIKVRRISF